MPRTCTDLAGPRPKLVGSITRWLQGRGDGRQVSSVPQGEAVRMLMWRVAGRTAVQGEAADRRGRQPVPGAQAAAGRWAAQVRWPRSVASHAVRRPPHDSLQICSEAWL